MNWFLSPGSIALVGTCSQCIREVTAPESKRAYFSTRSSDRPNPIGLHDVVITAVDGRRLQVRHLEALNGTPIIDVKPVLSRDIRQR